MILRLKQIRLKDYTYIIKTCISVILMHPKSNVRAISGGKIRGGKSKLPWDSAINWAVVYRGNQ